MPKTLKGLQVLTLTMRPVTHEMTLLRVTFQSERTKVKRIERVTIKSEVISPSKAGSVNFRDAISETALPLLGLGIGKDSKVYRRSFENSPENLLHLLKFIEQNHWQEFLAMVEPKVGEESDLVKNAA
jgi:hypothetical protein